MGINVLITGIMECDEEFTKMKNVYNACVAAKVEIPDEVIEYYGGNYDEDIDGKEVNIARAIFKGQEYGDDIIYSIEMLPPHVKYIRIRKEVI